MKSSMAQAKHGVLKIGIYRKEMTFSFSQPCPEFFQGGATNSQRSQRSSSKNLYLINKLFDLK